MFAKRKPRQEDEPLVPHGLVWQATDMEPPAKSGPEQAEIKPLRTQSGPSSLPPAIPFQATAPVAPKKPAASSPPLFWHPHKPPEIVKPDTAASGSQPNLLPSKIVPQNPTQFINDKGNVASGVRLRASEARCLKPDAALANTQNIGNRPSLWQQVHTAGSAAISAGQKTVSDIAAGLRRPIRKFGQLIPGAIQRMRARLPSKGGLSILKARFRGGLDLSSERLRRAVTRVRRLRVDCETLGKAYFTKTLAYGKLHSERLKPKLQHLRPRLMRVNMLRGDFSQTPPRQNGTARPGLRVRIAGLPLRMRILITRAISEWRLKTDTAAGDSRLWTSMTMSVCTALLALAIVSSARHYGNASLPSHLVQPNLPQNPAVTTPPAVVSSRPATARTLSKPKTHEAQAARPRPVQNARQKSKQRRNGEDDYVARDTYVYYGDSRPKSR